MFKLPARILSLLLAFALSPASAQELTQDIQDIPYELLQSLAENTVDFDDHSDWGIAPQAFSQIHVESAVSFASAFEGQTVKGQRADNLASRQLSLQQLTRFNDDDKLAAFSHPTGYRTLPSYVRRSIYLPLRIGGLERLPANMLSGYSMRQSNKVLTSLSPRLQLNTDGSWNDYSVLGIEPIAVLFDDDQAAVGLSFVALNIQEQDQYVRTPMYETLIRIKFFRRDGTFISEISFESERTVQLAFARCSGVRDIAGIQITNTSGTGFAIDDIIFGQPELEPTANPILELGNSEVPAPTNTNPLDVKPCSFTVS